MLFSKSWKIILFFILIFLLFFKTFSSDDFNVYLSVFGFILGIAFLCKRKFFKAIIGFYFGFFVFLYSNSLILMSSNLGVDSFSEVFNFDYNEAVDWVFYS